VTTAASEFVIPEAIVSVLLFAVAAVSNV